MSRHASPEWIDSEIRNTNSSDRFERLLFILARDDYPMLPISTLTRLLDLPYHTLRRWDQILKSSGRDSLLLSRSRGGSPDQNFSRSPDSEVDTGWIPDDSGNELALTMLHFLDRAPMAHETDWLPRMQEHLKILLPASHFISLTLRSSARIISTKQKRGGKTGAVTHVVGDPRIEVSSTEEYRSQWKRHLHQAMVEERVSFAEYTFPIAREYSDPASDSYLGSVFFFRDRTASPLTVNDHKRIDYLQPLIIHVMVSRILWIQAKNPAAGQFSAILPTIFTDENSLTGAEELVAVQLILGRDDKSIAETLNLGITTVRSHVRKILKKSDSRSRLELMGRVLTAFMVSPPSHPKD